MEFYSRQRKLADCSVNSLDLKYPPTSVGGIQIQFRLGVCSRDLNNPPTAVGGIWKFCAKLPWAGLGDLCKAAVGGIWKFCAKLPWPG